MNRCQTLQKTVVKQGKLWGLGLGAITSLMVMAPSIANEWSEPEQLGARTGLERAVERQDWETALVWVDRLIANEGRSQELSRYRMQLQLLQGQTDLDVREAQLNAREQELSNWQSRLEDLEARLATGPGVTEESRLEQFRRNQSELRERRSQEQVQRAEAELLRAEAQEARARANALDRGNTLYCDGFYCYPRTHTRNQSSININISP